MSIEFKKKLDESLNIFLETLTKQKFFKIDPRYLNKRLITQLYNIVASRSFGCDVYCPVMVPVGDMFNHGYSNSDFYLEIYRNIEK